MQELSAKVYPLLIWSLHLYSKGNGDFTPNDWREVLVNDKKDSKESMRKVQEMAQSCIEKILKGHENEIADKDVFESKMLTEKGLTPENTYLFVRGHELADNLLNAVLWPMTSELHQKHIEIIKADGGADMGRRIQEYRKSVKPVKEVLDRNYSYKQTNPLYKRIVFDINSIWA